MGLPLRINIVVLAIVFAVLDIVVLAGRFYSRRKQGVSFGADDYLILPGALAAVTLSALMVVMVFEDNLGGTVSFTPTGEPTNPDQLKRLLQLEFALQILSVVALLFTKVSILFFYRRIFHGRRFSIVSWVLIALSAAWGVAFFFATVFECDPISRAWTIAAGERKCYRYIPVIYGTAVSNFLIDLLILIVPQPIVWRLRMPTKQKIAVSIVFLLGAFVCGISVVRIYFFVTKHYSNVTNSIAPAIYWSQLEATVAVICACLPTMTPIFIKTGKSVQNAFRNIKTHTLSNFNDTNSDRFDKPMMTDRSLKNSQMRDERLTGVNNFTNISSSASIRGGVLNLKDLEGKWEPREDQIVVHTTIMSNEEDV